MATRSLSKAKKSSSLRQRGGSCQHSSQEIDSLSLSDDPDHSVSASHSAFGLEEIPSPPQSVILEDNSLQPDSNMALADSHLLVKSSVSTAEENPQHVSSAPKTFLTHEKAYPAISTNELATPSETATLSASSITLSSSPEVDTQPEGLNQTCSPVACTHLVSTVEPTDSTLSPNASGLTHEVSQYNSLDIADQTSLATLSHRSASHDSTIGLPLVTSSQTKYKTVSNKMKELYLDGDAIPSMSGILQKCVKYHKETADFQDGVCLVTKVLKGMGAIIKPLENLTGYFDPDKRKRVKQELKKEQAGLESL
jgi:hypothetical protein